MRGIAALRESSAVLSAAHECTSSAVQAKPCPHHLQRAHQRLAHRGACVVGPFAGVTRGGGEAEEPLEEQDPGVEIAELNTLAGAVEVRAEGSDRGAGSVDGRRSVIDIHGCKLVCGEGAEGDG